MSKVLVTRVIPGPAIEMIRDAGHELVVNPEDRLYTREELHATVKGCDGVLTQLGDPVDRAFMEAAGEQLKVVSNFAVGYNNIDVDVATELGVQVANTPGVLTDATADIAWVLLMSIARRVIEGDRMVRTGGFDGWTPSMLLGGDLNGKTIAIVGAGRIGYAVAKRAKGWDMEVVYVARSDHDDFENDLGAKRVSLEEALKVSDFVSLHTPLTEETRHLINAERLRMMKPSAYLVNTARGPVVDEVALVEALRENVIAGAGLDVYEEEPAIAPGLAALDNVVLLPHLGSATHETRAKMSSLAAENLLNVLAGKKPVHGVNEV